MKRLLPIIASFIFVFVVSLSPSISLKADAATCGGPGQSLCPDTSTDSRWVIDPEVTFIGKNARRSGDFLNWTLQNYNWVCVQQLANGTCNNNNNPIAQYWSLIVLYIVVPMLFFVILITSGVIIVTRGKSLTIMRFIPRFIAVVLLIVFSYSLLQFFYQITDLIQGFFLRVKPSLPCPPNCISDSNLLYVGWSYKDFVGLRLLGDQYAESAFISLLLTKLTALTYFVMVFLLLVRKIILWFFIVVSPIFPILLLYYPVRNTGKIWIGEFFRWLLYAPLFAIFLNGLVYLWSHQIPLVFTNANIGSQAAIEYPTAVNILLGGPGQVVSPTNSVNLVQTFALYVVSLIMLWIVILLPWILLQIFLDYAQNFAPGDTAVMKTLVNIATKGGGGPGTQPPSGEKGAALSLPFAKRFSIPIDLKPGPTGAAKELNVQGAELKATFAQPISVPSANVNVQVLNSANIKMPSLRDIARFDVAFTSHEVTKQQEVSRFTQQLVKIANPVAATNAFERNQMSTLRGKLTQQGESGNIMANSLLNAANASTQNVSSLSNQKVKNMLQQMSNPASASPATREKMNQVNQVLQKESTQNNNQLASSILSVNEKTSDKEIQKIKEQLMQSSNTTTSKAVTSALTQTARESSQVQSTIKQVSNLSSVVKTADKEHVTKLHDTLEKASKDGNQLATAILSVNEKTSATEIEALQQRIQEAKDKGDSVASEVTETAKTTNTTTLPTVNRVQNVSKEDYQAVKDMWKQNYQKLEVPQGMAGSRADWVKDDIASIDETIGLLSSPDADKVQQGMDQVSNLLPFLLVGGFSQTQIVEYLKAKQDAAKEVSKIVAVEDEEKIAVGVAKKTATAQQTMSASVETNDESDEGEESPLTAVTRNTTPSESSTSLQSNNMFSLANLEKPKITDIAKFEVSHLTKDKEEAKRLEQTRGTLEKLANPANFISDPEHAQIEQLRQKLSEESQKGDQAAASILSAANSTTAVQDISQLSQGKALSDEQLEEVKKLWKENYKTLPVPQEFPNNVNGRVEWIKKDSEDIVQTLALLQAPETEKKNEGLKKISTILPFLLLGGFSLQEMIGYLNAKHEAAEESVKELDEEESNKVSVSSGSTTEEKPANLTTEEENK